MIGESDRTFYQYTLFSINTGGPSRRSNAKMDYLNLESML